MDIFVLSLPLFVRRATMTELGVVLTRERTSWIAFFCFGALKSSQNPSAK